MNIKLSQTMVGMLAAMAWTGGTLHAQEEGEKAKLAIELGMPFTDHAVLQQKIKLPVWGTSLPGAKVTVRFNGQSQSTPADGNGKWRVLLDPMDAVKLKSVTDCPAGKTMTIVCEKDGKKAAKEIKDLILCDVWLCAGQSNMAGRMKRAGHPKNYPANSVNNAKYPALRLLAIPKDQWLVCNPETAVWFSRIAFFFARRVQHEALVPMGVMVTAVGGSNIESWLNQSPYPTGGHYTNLLQPVVGYGIRGAIWYQGESNEKDRRGYQPKLESLITGWRKVWGQGDFPV
jgi:sialate O-acetylesterase